MVVTTSSRCWGSATVKVVDCPRSTRGAGPGISSSWRIEPSSPPATWTIEEYTIGDLVSVRPHRGSFEPVGVAHGMTSHIEPLAAQARPVRTRQHRIKHDTRMLDRRRGELLRGNRW